MSPRVRAYLFLLIASIIWGTAGPIIKNTLQYTTPAIFLLYRYFFSFIIGLLLFRQTFKHFPRQPKAILGIILFSILATTVGHGLIFLGFDFTGSLVGTVIVSTAPIFVGAAATSLLNEHVTKREKIGMALATAGTTITILGPLSTNGFFHTNEIIGNLLMAGFLVVFVIQTIWAKKILRSVSNPEALSNFSFIVGFFSFLPLVLLTTPAPQIYQAIRSLPLPAHLGTLFMAVLSGNIAHALYYRGQKTIEASEASAFTYLEPVWAAPLALIWLKESVSPAFLLGAAVIAVGVALAEIKPHRQ